MNFAPIALFVYNRPYHLKKTLNSLKKNLEIKNTLIYVFSDGPKNNFQDIKNVKQVRKILKNVNFCKKKIIIEKKKNIGLKKNILDGINHVFKRNKKIIVLEDDIVVNKYFLNFMNTGLKKYYKSKKIWHISGWNYSINNKLDKNHSFFIKNMNCWGWGTWKDKWIKAKFNSNFYIKKFTKEKRYKFDLDNSFENYSQIFRNSQNKISTWAIFWNATIFFNDGLCLNPYKSLTMNIGQDKSGTNTINYQLKSNILNNLKIENYPDQMVENKMARYEIITFLNRKRKKSKLSSLFKKIFRGV